MLNKVEKTLEPILSPRQPLATVEASLKLLDEEDRLFALHWIEVIAVSNIELAYTFSILVGNARKQLSERGVRAWLHESLALYDQEGLYPAIQVLRDIRGFVGRYARLAYTCRLEDVKPGLELFIRGLAGRELTLKPSETVYTDTKTLYLPASISKYRDTNKNRRLYKAMACFLWAQTWYGTFRRKGGYSSPSTLSRLEAYENTKTATRYFLALENIRLLAKINRDLPGLHREMKELSPLRLPGSKLWRTINRSLSGDESSVEDTFKALDSLIEVEHQLPLTSYQGDLNLLEVEIQIESRKDKALKEVQSLLDKELIDQSQLQKAAEAYNSSQAMGNEIAEPQGVEGESEDSSDGCEKSPEENKLNDLIQALLQDVQYLEDGLFSGDGLEEEYDGKGVSDQGGSDMNASEDLGRKILELEEWDYLRQSYRADWCQVSIKRVEELKDGFRQETERKYPFLMKQIRKVFEAMRDQPRHANRQTDGEDIDLDAVVEMYTARLAGEELSERMYIRRQRNDRSVSVCLLVDMSGSTKGWINLAMRESLILFSTALNTLGDPYAILGFSGLTRQRCEIYTVKEFEDIKTLETSNRISNIQAKDYTRMGFAVRYATRCLLKSEAKHRILLMLSDGKPDDYDGYQGEYGIQDTRKAILEAQGYAIRPYSITIDKRAQAYLPRLFGPGQYTILNDVSTLPLKLSEIYKQLSN